VIGRARHLQEERLFDCYLAERGGDPIDLPAAEHLADCAECGARYADLVHFMDNLREEADAETGEIFIAERLRLQQQQILRRIEHIGRPARVISFPRQFVARHISPAAHGLTRWVYAAAAAGLVVGVALGAVYESEWRALQTGRRPGVYQLNTARTGRGVAALKDGLAPGADVVDDAFLSDLEMALEQPHTRSLQPFDALTPHVRDMSERVEPVSWRR